MGVLVFDAELRCPRVAVGLGGVRGPAIKPIGLACVWKIFERVRIPIVGVGGIQSGQDAVEYLLAGASAVQVGTAVALEGAAIFARLVRELEGILEERPVHALAELVGAAHPALRPVPPSSR